MQLKFEYKKLPKNVLFIYTDISATKYGIINIDLSSYDKDLMKEACLFLYKKDAVSRIAHLHAGYDPEEMEQFKEYLATKKALKKEFLTISHEQINAYCKRRDEKLA